MPKYYKLFLLAAFGLLIASCNSDGTRTNETKSEDMAQFADDKKFKDAHEKPEAINFQGEGKMMTFETADGKPGSAYAIVADQSSKKVLFVIHEWYGLNDHIKREAERLFGELEGVNVYALALKFLQERL